MSDTPDAMSDEQLARQTESPEEGYPTGSTDPHGGLRGDEGKVNADATPKIADDAEKGQTAVPAAGDDANEASGQERPPRQ